MKNSIIRKRKIYSIFYYHRTYRLNENCLFFIHKTKRKRKNKILFTQICHEDEQANKEYEDSLGFFISSTTQSDN
jgi:hypothetical protein